MSHVPSIALAATLLASLAASRGEGTSLTLDQPSRTVQPGDFLTFEGTIRNDGPAQLFLNGNRLALTLHGTDILPAAFDLHLDDSPFQQGAPPTLGPGQQWSGTLFRLKVGLDAPATTWHGSLSLLGGAAPEPFDPLAMAAFDLTLPGPQPAGAPAAPAALRATPAGTMMLLEWSDLSSDEEGFHIEHAIDGGAFASAGLVGAGRQSFTVGALDPGASHFFRVRAFNGHNSLGVSPWSNIALGRLSQPGPPSLLSWTAGGWAYMNPMGGSAVVLPPRPADGTPDPDFDTTWFLPETTFATQYDGPTFGASPPLTGTPGNSTTYDSGTGTAPLGYPPGGMDYFFSATAEFTVFGTSLTSPSNNQRRTSYYRRTFTVPEGPPLRPAIRFLVDDGAYFYLDGTLVATVNIAPNASDPTKPAADVFNSLAPANGNEASIETIDLSGAPGAVPGTASARRWATVPGLAPGTHTLAVSLHNTFGSGDSCLAVELGEPPPAQTVFIAAADPSAQVATADTGTIVVARTGDLTVPLEVPLALAAGPGQAARGTRYALVPDQLVASFPAGAQSVAVTVAPLADTAVLGSESVTLQVAAGPGYFVGQPSAATVQLLDSPINAWKVQQFGSLAAAQGPAAADDAAPAGDGVANLLKYALGLTALAPSADRLPVGTVEDFGGQSHLTLTFSRPSPPPADISYHVECTTDPAHGPWQPAEPVPGYPLPGGAGEILKYRDPEPSTGKPRDFIRLRVTRP